jgi:hypothetical protein
MRYYDIVDGLLELWRSQPFFGTVGINMAMSQGTVLGLRGL